MYFIYVEKRHKLKNTFYFVCSAYRASATFATTQHQWQLFPDSGLDTSI
jgi:hypothetical protein